VSVCLYGLAVAYSSDRSGAARFISDNFEWDDEKAQPNPERHDGVTFEDAACVFDELFASSREDRRVAYDEQHFIHSDRHGR